MDPFGSFKLYVQTPTTQSCIYWNKFFDWFCLKERQRSAVSGLASSEKDTTGSLSIATVSQVSINQVSQKMNVYCNHPSCPPLKKNTVDDSLRGSGSLSTPGCISRSSPGFDTWIKASSVQSIKSPGWPVPNWNTINAGERMFFLFVYLDASVKPSAYLFCFKVNMDSMFCKVLKVKCCVLLWLTVEICSFVLENWIESRVLILEWRSDGSVFQSGVCAKKGPTFSAHHPKK